MDVCGAGVRRDYEPMPNSIVRAAYSLLHDIVGGVAEEVGGFPDSGAR
jgi:hypothetical protein